MGKAERFFLAALRHIFSWAKESDTWRSWENSPESLLFQRSEKAKLRCGLAPEGERSELLLFESVRFFFFLRSQKSFFFTPMMLGRVLGRSFYGLPLRRKLMLTWVARCNLLMLGYARYSMTSSLRNVILPCFSHSPSFKKCSRMRSKRIEDC